MFLPGKIEYLEGATALVKKGKSMLTKKQLNAWNTADERALQHATPGSPRFLICTSFVNGGPRNAEPGPRTAIWFITPEELEALDASPSRSALTGYLAATDRRSSAAPEPNRQPLEGGLNGCHQGRAARLKTLSLAFAVSVCNCRCKRRSAYHRRPRRTDAHLGAA